MLVGAPRAELPVGWEVEIFAGRIVDLAFHRGVVAGATDGGLLLHDVVSGDFRQIADAGCLNDCLRSNRLTAVDIDATGRVWVGSHAAGITALRPEAGGFEYVHFFGANFTDPDRGLLADSVVALDAWADESVYAVTTSGVAQIDLGGAGRYNDAASRRPGQAGFPVATLYDVAVDSSFVWVASDSGVIRYERQTSNDAVVLRSGFATPRVNVIEILAGDVFAGTQDGVYGWNDASGVWERIGGASAPSFRVHSLARVQDPFGSELLLFAGSDRVRGFRGEWGECNPPSVPLVNARSFPAMVASGDTVWTSHSNALGAGAFLERYIYSDFDCSQWKRFAPNSIPVSEVRFVDLTQDRSELWVALRFAGVARRDNATGIWCEFNLNDPDVAANMSDPAGRASAFAIDHGGSAWFTTLPIDRLAPVDRLDADPACVHANDGWDHIDPGELGFGGRYWKIVVDGAGNRFFLADSDDVGPGGLEVLSADDTQHVALRTDPLPGRTVGAIAFETGDGAWATAYLGFNTLSDQGLVRWRNSDDLFNPQAANFTTLRLGNHAINEYRDMEFHAETGHLWIGTDAGLVQYDTDSRTVLSEIGQKSDLEDGLLSTDVQDVLIDDRDNLWIATANGLNRIVLGDTSQVIDAFTTREKIAELNESIVGAYLLENTLAPLPAPKVGALSYDESRGLLHIGTEGGLATVDVDVVERGGGVPVGQAVVYPNPVRVFGDDDPNGRIFVGNVTTPATVTVYNLEGEIVSVNQLMDLGQVAWNLQIFVTNKGITTAFDATSGVYLVRIESEDGVTVTPLVVIR